MRPQAVKREPDAIFVTTGRRPDFERRYRRRRLIAAVLVVLGVLALGAAIIGGAGDDRGGNPAGAKAVPVELRGAEGSRLATLSPADAAELARGQGKLPIPAERTVEGGSSSVTYRLDQATLRDRLAAASGGSVLVPERPISSRISTPVVQQQFQNNCETAALSMLLASQGEPQDQVALQNSVRTDGPLDPGTGAGGEIVWGDPAKGFVGRVDGGGTAGGYGVYEQPILELAQRWIDPVDLSGKPPAALYDQLLEGKPVFAWIGLQDGPFETWRNLEGKEVTVNYGEHTVLLVGIDGDRLLVNDPIDGQRKWWTKAEFELMFERLDRRAISVA